MYDFTAENKADLRALVRQAQALCTERSDLFINHSAFYPKLDPEYAKLVPLYTQAAKDAGAEVHDGAEFVGSIKLRDTMHFAAESTREVVEMYISAVRSMLEMQPPRDVQQNADERMAASPEILLSDEEPDPPDPKEDWLPGSPPEPRESAEAVRKQLLEKFNQWNSGNNVKSLCLNASFRKGSGCCLPVCQRGCHNVITVSTSTKNSGSLSATHLIADRWSVIRPHGRCIGVRNASSRAPSVVTTGAISLPASEKKRGKSASSMPRGIVCTSAVHR
jgi:hypothetical protein